MLDCEFMLVRDMVEWCSCEFWCLIVGEVLNCECECG